MDIFFDAGQFLNLQKNAAKRYAQLIEQAAEKHGVSRQEADVLLFFANNPQCNSAIDAVRLRGLSKAYISKAVEQLSKKQFISLDTNPNDRRYQHISLTAACRPTLSDLQEAQRVFLSMLFAGFSEEEQHQVAVMLHRMTQNMAQQGNNNQ